MFGRVRLTLWDAMVDLGWFSTLFALVLGGPSVLALLQTVFVEHRLIDALQWIIDGYHKIITVVGAVFEPLLQPIVTWLGDLFGWRLELHPHWKPLFVLAMVAVTGIARTTWRDGEHVFAILFGMFCGVGALIGSAIAGLFPLEGGWWAQGLMVGVPTAALIVGIGIYAALYPPASFREVVSNTIIGIIAGAIAFVLGAGVSFIPGVRDGAGVLSIGLVIIGMGWLLLHEGLKDGQRSACRGGLTILGGFVAAGFIVAADALAKALGAA